MGEVVVFCGGVYVWRVECLGWAACGELAFFCLGDWGWKGVFCHFCGLRVCLSLLVCGGWWMGSCLGGEFLGLNIMGLKSYYTSMPYALYIHGHGSFISICCIKELFIALSISDITLKKKIWPKTISICTECYTVQYGIQDLPSGTHLLSTDTYQVCFPLIIWLQILPINIILSIISLLLSECLRYHMGC